MWVEAGVRARAGPWEIPKLAQASDVPHLQGCLKARKRILDWGRITSDFLFDGGTEGLGYWWIGERFLVLWLVFSSLCFVVLELFPRRTCEWVVVLARGSYGRGSWFMALGS